MSSGLQNINLKVLLMDTDFYALQAVNSYLAWDRRTRVTLLADSPEQMWRQIKESPFAERPDVVIMDADHFGAPEGLRRSRPHPQRTPGQGHRPRRHARGHKNQSCQTASSLTSSKLWTTFLQVQSGR